MLQEFKAFAMKGNMIDLAIGVIIGAAFGKVVSSLVNDILMPPLGILIGGVDFSNLALTLKPAVGDIPPVEIKWGLFVNNVVNFLIVAFTIFMVIKFMNRWLKLKVSTEEPKK